MFKEGEYFSEKMSNSSLQEEHQSGAQTPQQHSKRFLTESLTTLHIYEKDMIRLCNFKIHKRETHKDAFQRLLDSFLDLRHNSGIYEDKIKLYENRIEELEFIQEDLKKSLNESRFIRNRLECELELLKHP